MNEHAVTQDRRSTRLDEVAALVGARIPAEQRTLIEAFVRAVLRPGRPRRPGRARPRRPLRRRAFALAFARKREPGRPSCACSTRARRARLAVDAHRDRDRQRRHAVPGRLGDDGGQPARARCTSSSTRPRHRARRRRHASRAVGGRPAQDGAARVVDPRRGRSRHRRRRSCEALARDIVRVLGDVRAAVEDWQPMRSARRGHRRRSSSARRRRCRPKSSPRAAPSSQWLADDHFTFLGYRDHDLVTRRRRGPAASRARARASASCARPRARTSRRASPRCRRSCARYARGRELLVITKSTSRSTVHRPGYLDYIGVKRFDASGKVCGEHRFLGPLHVVGLQREARRDPAAAPQGRERASSAPASRRTATPARRSLNILETYPRDELFQIDDDELLRDRDGHPAPRRPPALAPVRAARSVRALRLVPDLRAARELHHRPARRSGRRS